MKKITLLMHSRGIRKAVNALRTTCYVFMLLFFVQEVSAQTGTTYAFSQTTGTFTPITGGNVLGTSTTDDEVFNNNTAGQSATTTNTGFPIGFNFVFNGGTYDKFAVNANGWIRLGSGSFAIEQTSTGLSSSTSSPVVAGLSIDLAAKAASELSYLTTGTAPNRKLVVQWKSFSKYSSGGNASDITFQIVLNETTNNIDVVYGAVSTPATITGTAEVGIKSGSTLAEINNRTSTTAWNATTAGTATSSSITFSPTIVPVSGLTYTWTPVACSGTVAGGTLGTTLTRLICTGSAPGSITVTGTPAFFAGITYQWEQSTDNGTTWANVTGGTGGTNSATYTPVNFAGTSIKYRVRITCANGGSTATSDVMTINPTAAPATQATALTQGNAGYTSMTLSWTNGDGGRRVVYFSNSPITNPVSGTAIPAYTAAAAYTTGQQLVYEGTGSSVTITGLTCGTTYYATVFDYNRCGSGPYDVYFNTTSGTNALTLTTPAVKVLPSVNAFTGFTGANMATAASGWFEAAITTAAGSNPTTANPAGLTSAWTNSAVFAGVTTAKINLLNATKNEWIISPKLAITAASRVKFKAAITDAAASTVDPAGMQGTDDKVIVMITTDCGVTWAPLYTFSATNTTTLTNVLTDFAVNIPASYIGQTVQIGFQATEGPLDDTPSYDFHLSNITVEATPTCDKPNLTATTNITKNSATINWTVPAAGVPTGYQYVVSTSSTTPAGAGTAVTGTATTANVASLTPSTLYYVFVRTACSADFSDWTTAGTFRTLCNSGDITSNTPGTRCGTGAVTVSAVASTGTVKWYAAATGGTPIAAGASYSPVLSATTTYYAGTEASSGLDVIGTGTAQTGDTDVLTAFCNRFSSYKMQIIYTAAELSAAGIGAGEISSIGFNTTSLGDGATNDNFTVKMGATTDATFATTTYVTTGLNTVYGPVTHTHTASGWQFINFTTPYVWNGTSNIIIEVTHSGANLTNSARTYYTPTTGSNTILYSTGSTSTTGTQSVNRLNIMFGTCASPTRVPVVATVNTAPAFTLSTATVNVCTGQSSTAVTVATGAADYNTYVWTPSTGVTGNATSGWIFNPSASTVYTLQATQSAGAQCATTATVSVSVSPYPTAISVSAAPIVACANSAQPLTVSGGTISGVSTLGTGTTSPTATTMPQPFTAWYGGAKTQMLIKESELLAQGMVAGSNLNTIAFDFEVSSAFACNDLRIKIGPTTNANMSGGLVSSTTLTTVYNATWTPTAGTTGFVPFTLSTPYTWTGGDIIVEVAHNQGNGGNGSGTRTRITTTSFVSIAYGLKDSVTPAGMDSFDATALTVIGSNSDRPNIRFNYGINSNMTWSPVTNLYTNAAATTAYVAGTNAPTVYFKSATTAPAVTYTATATNSFGCSVNTTVSVSVNTSAAPTATAAQTFCNSGTIANLTATGTAIKWYADATGGTSLAPTAALVNGENYFATQTVDGCESITRAEVVVTINTPAAPAIANSAQTFCNSGTVANLMPNDASIKWYAAATGGTALASTVALVNGTTYYASQTVNGCEGLVRGSVTATINVVAAPAISNDAQVFCNNATIADLLPNGAEIKWYAAATGGTALLATDALVSGTTYYASQTVSGCEGLLRGTVTATVLVTPAPTVADQIFCNAATVADLLPNDASIKWYAAATGGTVLASTEVLVSGTTYYASQTIDGCEGLVRSAAIATVNVTPAPTGDDEQEFCTSATIGDLVATGNTITWYDDATAGNALTVDVALVDGTTYYASQSIDGCVGLTRLAVTAVIHTVVVDAPEDVSVCTEYVLPALTSGAYYTQTGGQGTEVAAGASITETTTLYVYAQEGTDVVCSDENSFTVTVANIPAPTGDDTQIIEANPITDAFVSDLQADAQGTVVWYATLADAQAGTNPLGADTPLVQGATYYATQTVDTCTSVDVFAVTVDIVLDRDGFDIKAFSYYPNPVKDVLNISYSSEITTVTVFNLLGQRVISQQSNADEVKVDMSSLADGAYIVNVASGNTVKTIKVIKKQ